MLSAVVGQLFQLRDLV